MFSYIFIIISVLLIIKPTVNSIFLSELGAEQLPLGYILVAAAALLSSLFYSKLLVKYQLNRIIKSTLALSIIILILLATLLKFGWMSKPLLFFFYAWIAIYAVLSASQFWVLANMVFNVRDAKRLFGFVGSGAILGGIFGGYLTSIFVPIIGNEVMIGIAAMLLLACFPLLGHIWKLRVNKLNDFKKEKQKKLFDGHPFQLIKKSRHLTFMALIVAVGVVVARLVDYQFSDFASRSFEDPEDLTAFLAFWFSSFNLLSLGIQLFLTHRIVGIWGVGFSLLMLPLGILFGSIFFLILPELSAIVVIKGMDGILKQSVNKSASELLALPLPFDLKNKTKSFIDVVVDSIATGIAGLLLIFFVKGLDLETFYISLLILFFVVVWIWLIGQVRKEYYATFKRNLEAVTASTDSKGMAKTPKLSVVHGMKKVFNNGTEEQQLFMLDKLMEINDSRFTEDVLRLLAHPSIPIKTAALRNLYFLDSSTMAINATQLLSYRDQDLTLATMEYLLLHADQNPEFVFELYLDDHDEIVADTALFCLAKESTANATLRTTYRFKDRLKTRLANESHINPLLLKTIGTAGLPEYFHIILEAFKSDDITLKTASIEAAGMSMNPVFIKKLLEILPDKSLRRSAVNALNNYGRGILPILVSHVKERLVPLEACRFVPLVIKSFGSKEAVDHLFQMFDDVDLSVRIEVVRAMSELRKEKPNLKFNRFKVVSRIYDECKLYHHTMSSMHTQIIVSYRNRKKSGQEVKPEEREARATLLDLLERRLDTGLERIFKLLGLKFPQSDVQIAYEGLLSPKEEARANALDFLDNLLTGNLKQKLLPIIEEATMDVSSEEAIQRIKHNVPSELECFQQLLEIPDVKLNLAVLFLIGKQRDQKYMALLTPLAQSEDAKIKTFAENALREMGTAPSLS